MFFMKLIVFRQILSALIVMLAFGVLTAHEVIPHHHHADHICLEKNGGHSEHSHDAENADHPGESCELKDIPVVTSSNPSQEFASRMLFNDQKTNHDHHACLNDYQCNILLLTTLPFRQTPFDNFLTIPYRGTISGLRAPPVA
ncbi:MAG: hypothetical protein R6U64_08490 [Bacteroidales bacterium]